MLCYYKSHEKYYCVQKKIWVVFDVPSWFVFQQEKQENLGKYNYILNFTRLVLIRRNKQIKLKKTVT